MGTPSSLEKFGPATGLTARPMNNTIPGATLQPTTNGVEKAFSMNSINEQSQSSDTHYRNNSFSSNDSSSGSTPLQTPRQQRPRSAPNNQSIEITQGTHTTLNEAHPPQPEIRRMAVCEANVNDDAESARRKMRVYQKRF